MLIDEDIADAQRHLDVRLQSLLISREKDKNGDCTELERSCGLLY